MNLRRMATFIVAAALAAPALAPAQSVSGTIGRVMAGYDDWYGVRFYLTAMEDATGGVCSPVFVYTEPSPANAGHKGKVAVFTMAYLTGKRVTFAVAPGRGGYCAIVEGYVE